MPHPKIPKKLIGKVQRTGYGYISDDKMYRLFRYKWTHSYHQKEPQRWMLLKPDGNVEYFETMVEGRERIYELQDMSEVRKEERREERELKKKIKKRKEKEKKNK